MQPLVVWVCFLQFPQDWTWCGRSVPPQENYTQKIQLVFVVQGYQYEGRSLEVGFGWWVVL